MKWKKYFLLLFVSFYTFFSMNITVFAQEVQYQVVDVSKGSYETIENFNYYSEANRFYRNHLDEYDNLVLLENDTVLRMEYGIVEFKTSDACTVNIEYEEMESGKDGYLNGCYAIDAAYLSTSSNLASVSFKMAGVMGEVDFDQVILHPIDTMTMRLSSYINVDGILRHEVKTQLLKDFYNTSIPLGEAPSYLVEGKSYYSYDGHYFYEDFKVMIDDYRNGTYAGSVNVDTPYYNYYMYLPHRSLTSYRYDEIENYFYDVLCFDRKVASYFDLNRDNANDSVNESQYYGELKSFFEYQNIYGANALMMLSMSINESAYGKSLLSFSRNNLFGHAAFDSDVERSASRYTSVEGSVYSHAKYYISSRYSSHLSSLYRGSFFGDKSSGMNVMYSSDPYWGEKAASHYYELDAALGNRDLNRYALGFIDDCSLLRVYQDENLEKERYRLNHLKNYSFVILQELENSYKIQLDSAKDREQYRYDFDGDVGYIAKDVVDFILNPEKIGQKEFVNITFEGDGGTIAGEETLTMRVEKGQIPVVNRAIKDGYEFIGFDQEVKAASEDMAYVARYKKIDHIELVEGLKDVVEWEHQYDLKGAKLKVIYEDGSEKIMDIDTNMILSFDSSKEGEQMVRIGYCGFEIEYPVTISKELDQKRSDLNQMIASNINRYKENGSYDAGELWKIKEDLSYLDYVLSFEQIRLLDRMILEEVKDRIGFHISANDYEMSISGMALSLPYKEEDFEKTLFQNTYYADVKDVSFKSKKRLQEVSLAYGFEEISSFHLSFRKNLEEIDSVNPFIVQISIPNKELDKIYSVYRLDEHGSVYKCRSEQTASYIQFLTDGEGDFMILAMDSQNHYNLDDQEENIHKENQDIDIHGMFFDYAMMFSVLLVDLILVTVYQKMKKKEDEIWKDYKKSLRKVESVQEEKQKN